MSLLLTPPLPLPVSVANGGSGRATSTTAYALLAAGTTATGAQQSLAAGATTEILVGGGASALPVWTTATGTGAPARAGSPTFTTAVTITSASSSTLTFNADDKTAFVSLDTSGNIVARTATANANMYYDATATWFRNPGAAYAAMLVVDAAGIAVTGIADVTGDYRVDGTKVVGNQGAAVADASGGAIIDSEARTALNALLARIRTHGLIAT